MKRITTAIAIIFLTSIMLVYTAGKHTPIRTDKPIQPILEIRMVKGIADTTFVYERE